MTAPVGAAFEPADLFTFLRVVASTPELSDRAARTAVAVALSCDGTSGSAVTLDVSTLAGSRGVSERTLWRDLSELRRAGWLVQTTAPTYAGPSRDGRRARYRLHVPQESCATSARSDDTRQDVSRVPAPSDNVADDSTRRVPAVSAAVSHDTPSRVTDSVESCDTGERVGGTLSPPHGPSLSRSAPADDRDESEPAEQTFGTRAAAALGRTDVTARQLDQLHRTAELRLGLSLAADAVHAVVALPGVRNLAAYVAKLPDADWRDLAEQRRDREHRERRPRRSLGCERCTRGWLDDAERDPCLACRPHLRGQPVSA